MISKFVQMYHFVQNYITNRPVNNSKLKIFIMRKKIQFNCTLLSLVACCLFFGGCTNTNPELIALSQQVYSQKQWEEPLPPNDFVSDGCSLWPDLEWVECCVVHDSVYWLGGSRSERKQADLKMKQCVSKTGHPVTAWIMYFGVRATGVYWLPTSFRWGFGWEYPQSGPPGTPY